MAGRRRSCLVLLALLTCNTAVVAVTAAEGPAAAGGDTTLPPFVKVQLSFDGESLCSGVLVILD